MPLRIDRVDTELEVTQPGRLPTRPEPAALSGSDTELLERLRPIVLRILEEELERLRRERG
jgi:hypothetical protein